MRLFALPGIRGVGIGGAEYVIDADGAIEVPSEYVVEVLAAGFSVEPQTPALVAE